MEIGHRLINTVIRKVQRCWRTAIWGKISTADAIFGEYRAWRDRFLWQRLHLGIWIAILCVFTFILRDILQQVFHLQDVTKITHEIKNLALTINSCIFLCLLVCLFLHKTNIARRYPGRLFLCLSFSVTLVEQFVATFKGFALPDQLAWIIAFLTQAMLIPIRWYLHLGSQLGVVLYYFVVNSALGLKLPPPFSQEPIFGVTLILLIFWVCFICDLGVYLYERLQRSEFYARKELEIANQKLTVTEAKYRNIFENAVEGIFQSTADGRYITANPALARIYGYSFPEEVTTLIDIEHQLYVDPNRRAEFVRLIEEYGSVSEFESQIYRRDGSIVWISENAYAVRNSRGQLLYYEGMIEDITKRKQAEEALRVFFHAVSHDLRNPVLGTLMVLRNLLSRSEEKIAVSRFILERMEQSSDRQLSLINSLMEAHMSEVQGVALQLQPVELLKVVEAAIADLKPMLTENQALLINQVTADLPIINADPTQLWRVFSNLIVNAVKHNPPGLTITINASVDDDKIYCRVVDNGVGMSQKQSDRLFDLYFRGTPARNSISLGLGLYLCKQIITAHGGEIGVKSAFSAGATFWFTLPIFQADNEVKS
jgi:PAS domain S-box-containing protein